METLPVIFRMLRAPAPEPAWLLALFPTVPEGYGTCSSYAHIGQHGAADVALCSKGRPATPAEYGGLLAELRGIYEPAVRLRVMRRRPRARP